jgi:hypothetical protein
VPEEEVEQILLRPIINASYPATLAALSLAVLQVTGVPTLAVRLILGSGALMFTICAFTFFFYSIYPTRRLLWTATAITYIIGLVFTLLSVLSLILFVD